MISSRVFLNQSKFVLGSALVCIFSCCDFGRHLSVPEQLIAWRDLLQSDLSYVEWYIALHSH